MSSLPCRIKYDAYTEIQKWSTLQILIDQWCYTMEPSGYYRLMDYLSNPLVVWQFSISSGRLCSGHNHVPCERIEFGRWLPSREKYTPTGQAIKNDLFRRLVPAGKVFLWTNQKDKKYISRYECSCNRVTFQSRALDVAYCGYSSRLSWWFLINFVSISSVLVCKLIHDLLFQLQVQWLVFGRKTMRSETWNSILFWISPLPKI